MILSVEHKHPTARKRSRGVVRLVTLVGGRGKRPEAVGPSGSEAEIEDPTCPCTVALVPKREYEKHVGFR